MYSRKGKLDKLTTDLAMAEKKAAARLQQLLEEAEQIKSVLDQTVIDIQPVEIVRSESKSECVIECVGQLTIIQEHSFKSTTASELSFSCNISEIIVLQPVSQEAAFEEEEKELEFDMIEDIIKEFAEEAVRVSTIKKSVQQKLSAELQQELEQV